MADKTIYFNRVIEAMIYIGLIEGDDELNHVTDIHFGVKDARVTRWLADDRGILISMNSTAQQIEEVWEYDRTEDPDVEDSTD